MRIDSGMYPLGASSITAQTLYAHPINSANSKRRPWNVRRNGITQATHSTPRSAWKAKSHGVVAQILPSWPRKVPASVSS